MSSRSSAAKVARWLVTKEKRDEAVALLCAWAANGPNDNEGQELLAEALRIDPRLAARAARLRAHGGHRGEGPRAPSTPAIAQWTPEEIAKLEKQIARPNFMRAQVGFNNNVKYGGNVFHIQTEDSGLDQPHIITHLFADGGRIIKSHKRSYASEVKRDDVAAYVRALMKGQHMEMAIMLREGKLRRGHRRPRRRRHAAPRGAAARRDPEARDEEGDARRGRPRPALGPAAARAAAAAEPGAAAAPSPSVSKLVGKPAAKEQKARFRLHVAAQPRAAAPSSTSRSATPRSSAPTARSRIPGEKLLPPARGADPLGRRAALARRSRGRQRRLPPHPPAGRARDRRRVHRRRPAPPHRAQPRSRTTVPAPGPTYFYSSPKWPSSFRVVQIFEGGAKGACVVARGTTMQIGSAIGDFVFTDDPLVDDQHCLVEEQAGAIVLTDLESRTGVFVRIKGEQELVARRRGHGRPHAASALRSVSRL